MIEQLLPNVYRIEIPLPKNPLKVTNSYFIKGRDRNLLIDTGFNQEECRMAMDQAIKELGIFLENTDLFITHIHGDHSGLAKYLSRPDNKIYTGEYTANSLVQDKGAALETFYDTLLKESGLVGIRLTDHPGYTYASDPLESVAIVRDGDILEVGDIKLQCIETSGHAPDHFCLYDQEREILFSGDHILGKITPNNTIWDTPWSITRDYLGEYLKSLDKIAALKIKTIYPAHRFIIENPYERIEELKAHHQKRLENILEILGNESMTGAEVASKMKWDLAIKGWEEFPPAQKLFATGEALAHLTHLVIKNILTKELRDGVVYYSRI